MIVIVIHDYPHTRVTIKILDISLTTIRAVKRLPCFPLHSAFVCGLLAFSSSFRVPRGYMGVTRVIIIVGRYLFVDAR